MKKRPLLLLSQSAITKLRSLIHDRKYLRLSLLSKGCSGYSYRLEYIEDIIPTDIRIQQDDVEIFVDSKAALFLAGTEMDYEQDSLSQGFVFNNPNERGRCGCGESFHFLK